jgi:YfiH family protein
MKIFSDERLMARGIVSGTATRHTGSGRDIENVKKFFDKLSINSSKVLGLRQLHGTDVITMITDEDFETYNKTKQHNGDAWLLGREDMGVMILTADCVPLYIWDDKGAFVGLAHCGWRGVAAGLPAKITNILKARAPGVKLQAYIGPHIGAGRFEVKEDVASNFPLEAVINRDGKIYVDLTKAVIMQLTQSGVLEGDIRYECDCVGCTASNQDDFFSYRRDGAKDALISFVYKF